MHLVQVQGRVAELAASHTASRVIQACVKYGTAKGAELQTCPPCGASLLSTPL